MTNYHFTALENLRHAIYIRDQVGALALIDSVWQDATDMNTKQVKAVTRLIEDAAIRASLIINEEKIKHFDLAEGEHETMIVCTGLHGFEREAKSLVAQGIFPEYVRVFVAPGVTENGSRYTILIKHR